MDVLVKFVGRRPSMVELPAEEERRLSGMERIVGKPMELVEIHLSVGKIDMWLNGNGLGVLPVNFLLPRSGHVICGSVLFARSDGSGATVGLEDGDVAALTEFLRKCGTIDSN